MEVQSGGIEVVVEKANSSNKEGLDTKKGDSDDSANMEESKAALKQAATNTKHEGGVTSSKKVATTKANESEGSNLKAKTKQVDGVCRRYLLHMKKDRDDLAQALHTFIEVLSDSPVGKVDFEDIVNYLIQEKLSEGDFERIRELAFDRKLDEKIQQYNRENKTNLRKFEFLAQQCL